MAFRKNLLIAGALLVGASPASAETFTLEALALQNLSFEVGGLLFSNWSVSPGSVNAGDIEIESVILASGAGFILRDLDDELTANGDGPDSDFELQYSFEVSVIGSTDPGDPGIDRGTIQLEEFTVPPFSDDAQLAGVLQEEDGIGLDLWFAQNVSGLPDRTGDTDPLFLTPISLALTAGIGGQTFSEAVSASIESYSTTFTVVPVPAAVWLFGSALGLLGWVKRRTA